MGQTVLRTASLAALSCEVEETVTSHCWTPNGLLLLGTSAGHILRCEGELAIDCISPNTPNKTLP